MDDQKTKRQRPGATYLQPIFVDREAAAEVLTLSVSTFMREVRAGRLPKPRIISRNRVGWLWSELMAFAAAQPEANLLPPPRCDNRRVDN